MLEKLIRVIFPAKCIFCNQLIESDLPYDICPKCYLSLQFKDNSNKKALYAQVSNYFFDDVICIFDYAAMVRNSLKDFKFYKTPGYHRTFGKLLAENIKNVTKTIKFDIIVSIPLHKERLVTRGYNQSYLLSKVIAHEMGIPEKSYLLTRVKNTKSQSLLDKDERISNIQNAFLINEKKKYIFSRKRIILVDDVLTTGSTLNECSKVLKEAGAISVTVAVVASGKIF